MKTYRALMDGAEIAQKVSVADNSIKRLFGLMFKKEIDEDEGLLISPCSQIHTFGMKYPIDVVFLSKAGEVLHIENEMKIGNVSPFIRQCFQVLELKSGAAEKRGIVKGSYIAFDTI